MTEKRILPAFLRCFFLGIFGVPTVPWAERGRYAFPFAFPTEHIK